MLLWMQLLIYKKSMLVVFCLKVEGFGSFSKYHLSIFSWLILNRKTKQFHLKYLSCDRYKHHNFCFISSLTFPVGCFVQNISEFFSVTTSEVCDARSIALDSVFCVVDFPIALWSLHWERTLLSPTLI